MELPKDTPTPAPSGALEAPPIQWWKSRTIWGAIVAIVAAILRAFEIDIYGVEDELGDALFSIATIVGGLVAAQGRFTAKRKIATPNSPALLVLIAAALILTGCAGYRFTGSLSAGYQGQTVTLTSDGKTVNADVRLSDSRGYAK